MSIPIFILSTFSLFMLISSHLMAQGLERMIHSALLHDSGVQSQVFLERSSAAKLQSAKWQFYPTPSIDMQSAISGFESSVSERVITLSVKQPLWSGGRLQANVDAANIDLSIQNYTTQMHRVELAQQVVSAYGQWWVAHHKRLSWGSGLETHQKLANQVSRRVNVGVSAKSDLNLAQGRLSATLAEYNLTFAQEQAALDNLQLLTNIESLDVISEAQFPSMNVLLSSYTVLLEAALVNNLSIKLAQAKAEKALANQAFQKASLWPQFFIQAQRQIGDFNQNNFTSSNKVFFGASSDLKAGLSFEADRASSAAARSAALAQVDNEKKRITRELRSSLTLLIASNDRQLSLDTVRINAQSGYQSSSRQFKVGRKDWQELLNSARELAQADTQWVEAYSAYLVASWQILLDTQGLEFMSGIYSDE
jgi:adhesin transport system outer membrane protein